MCHQRLSCLLLSGLLALALPGHSQTKPAAAPVALKPGKPITQKLQAGQTYDYQVTLKAGQALKATVEQKGIDVLVTAYAPDGTKLANFDSPTWKQYKEFVTVVAPTAGRYRLVVSALEPDAAPGTFVMALDGILTPAQYTQSQADDRQRADAVAAYLRAPHPDKSSRDQEAEILNMYPATLMLSSKTPEVEQARWLEGTWTGTRKLYATHGDTGTLAPAKRVMRFNPKMPLLLEADWNASGKFEPLMVFEPQSRQWVTAYMNADEMGAAWGLLKGTDWQNNQLVLEGENTIMGMTSHERRTWSRTDDHTLRVLTEERKSDGSWMPTVETTYTKTPTGDITSNK